MKLNTFKRLLLSLGCRQRTGDVEHVDHQCWAAVWFDFPPHIHKRKQARKFAQAIRLLLPASCLMHADTEEVFGCQIIRVGVAEVERMLEEQAQRHEWGAGDDDPAEDDQAKAKILTSRPKCPSCGRRMPRDFDPAKHLCDDCGNGTPEARAKRQRRAEMVANAALNHQAKKCVGCGKDARTGFLYCGDCLQNAGPGN